MIAIIAFNIFKNFWSCYPVYGSLATAVNAKNYTLGAFLGVAAFLLIMEIIFFLWALTGPCAYGDRGTKRVDTGRGLFSFLFIGITVVAAGMFWNLIPSSPSPLTGLAGGLQEFAGYFCACLHSLFHRSGDDRSGWSGTLFPGSF